MRNQYDSFKWTSQIAILLFSIAFSSKGMAVTEGNANENAPRTPAQEKPKGETKKTLSFEDELVEGSTQKPELFYLFQKKNFNYKRLIKLRENFLPEMRKTSEDIQRVRSSN
jgi:hypothetical protein